MTSGKERIITDGVLVVNKQGDSKMSKLPWWDSKCQFLYSTIFIYDVKLKRFTNCYADRTTIIRRKDKPRLTESKMESLDQKPAKAKWN